jgi:hypothetical protein
MKSQAWYRQPMLLLVIGLPAAAVIAGFATLSLALRGSGDTGDPRVRRVAQTQVADLGPDRAAARLALGAVATLDADGTVTLRFEGAVAAEPELELSLRHVTDPGRDRAAALAPAGYGVYAGRLDAPRAAGAYNAELVPPDGGWRLVGRLENASSRVSLEAAVIEP